MKTQNEAHAVYNCAGRQQGMKRLAVLIMTKEDHAAMHEQARIDIDKIAQAAGVEMLKTARIAMRRGRRELQTMGVRELSKLLLEIREARDCEAVSVRTGIATGYANAMCHFGLMSEGELQDVIAVIGQAGEQTARRIEAASRPSWLRVIRKVVQA
ncbi:MAG: hypothetical protein HDR09_20190 [Lachnospiraceae bacterium]|nr:hypothetical protein [Lachnospiraceae bacterium]MBD5505996.1 hypothetical protein [Lachnospiraceae bacterium]